MDNIFRMREEILKYFMAERQESTLFFSVGLAALIASFYFYKSGSVYQSMAYPLGVIALIQLVVGGTEFFWTGNQIQNLPDLMANDPSGYKSAELARMASVNFKFKIYKGIEIFLIMVGILMTFQYKNNDFIYFIGVGLIIQSSIVLILDLFAERRANIYYEQIGNLIN